MFQRLTTAVSVAACCLASQALAAAGLSLPHFFSDHMVLQRDKPIAIHGTADPGASVKLSFAGKSVTATADAAGAWQASLAPQPANARGSAFTVTTGAETKTHPPPAVCLPSSPHPFSQRSSFSQNSSSA